MQKLVSVIIPCYNAEQWLAEAIDSCLQQTYSNIEIIVIDDGSTDNSLKIIQSYGDKITWESLPHNQGGNVARNRGIDISKGEYVQFLDADDYLLPPKIERQVDCLEETGADVVYGDWRHQYHLPNGTSYLDKLQIPDVQADILESLLANWWTAVASLLYRRTAVIKSGGWDKNLPVAQDRDFFLSVVMAGAQVVYQPGCYSIYRRYGNVTVSTASKARWVECQLKVMDKAENKLQQMNKLSQKYRHALAKCYFEIARESLEFDYQQYLRLLDKALAMFPDFEANSKRPIYKLTQQILGFRSTEKITSFFLLMRIFWRSFLNNTSYPKRKLAATSD